MHPERLSEQTKRPRNFCEPFPSKTQTSVKLSPKDILSSNVRLDIVIKEWAFSSDFQLPIEPPSTVNARITTIDGEQIATGYDRIIADGESIWLEVPRAKLKIDKFRPRQRTASRDFYTLSGVTAHFQKQTETGLSPRRHKLAVKVRRNYPSCRLYTCPPVKNWGTDEWSIQITPPSHYSELYGWMV